MKIDEILAYVNTYIVDQDSLFSRMEAYKTLYEDLNQEPKIGETWLVKIPTYDYLVKGIIHNTTTRYASFLYKNTEYVFLLEDIKFVEKLE